MKKNDGGAAFPVPLELRHGESAGLSLRDWFAGQILSSMNIDTRNLNDHLAIAEEAFGLADAMLAERAK